VTRETHHQENTYFLVLHPIINRSAIYFLPDFFHAAAYLAPCGRTVAVLQRHTHGSDFFFGSFHAEVIVTERSHGLQLNLTLSSTQGGPGISEL